MYTKSLQYSLDQPGSLTNKVVFDMCSFCICMSHVFNFENYIFDTRNILQHCLWIVPYPVQSPWNPLLIASFNAVLAPWNTFVIMLVPEEVFTGKTLDTSAEHCRKTFWNYSHKMRNWCSFLSCYCSIYKPRGWH